MMLLRNADLWHPLPHRMEEELVTRMMEQVKLAVQTAGDGWEETESGQESTIQIVDLTK